MAGLSFSKTASPLSFWKKFLITLDMIKFQHSLFAMPFALVSLLYATNGQPSSEQILLIVLCMITARNTAMSFNRIVDLDIDSKNPRTQNRPLVSGELSTRYAKIFCLINALLFIVLAAQFNPLTFWLSPVALSIVMGYSLTKRFTSYTQFFLGLALGISPLATWIAIRGELALFPVLIGLGVLLWVAGFDLIYSCQDHDFDKLNGLKNMVVTWGIKNALTLARLLHIFAMLVLILAGLMQQVSLWYMTGIALMCVFLIFEHALVKPHDLRRVNAAFFTLNGYVGMCYLGFVLLDLYV